MKIVAYISNRVLRANHFNNRGADDSQERGIWMGYGKRAGGLLLVLFVVLGFCTRSSAIEPDQEKDKKDTVEGSYVFTGTGEGSDANGLLGIRFILYKKNEKHTYTAVSDKIYETDRRGHIVLNGLAKGEYRLDDMEAPHGYGNIDMPISFVIHESGESRSDGRCMSGRPVYGNLACYLLPTNPSVAVEQADTESNTQIVYSIRPVIPTDIMIYETYSIWNQLDDRLRYVEAKVWMGDDPDKMCKDITGNCTIREKNGTVQVDMTDTRESICGKTIEIRVAAEEKEGIPVKVESLHNRAEVSYGNAYGDKRSF